MQLPSNVEKSAFRAGEYVAYDGLGWAWRLFRAGRDWRAVPAANNPARQLGKTITTGTLTAAAHTLASRKPAPVLEPF